MELKEDGTLFTIGCWQTITSKLQNLLRYILMKLDHLWLYVVAWNAVNLLYLVGLISGARGGAMAAREKRREIFESIKEGKYDD